MSSSGLSPTGSRHTVATILIVAAGRGLGHAMAEEFLKKGWNVIGTVRPGTPRTKLHELAEATSGQVEVETLDIGRPQGFRTVDPLRSITGNGGLDAEELQEILS